MKPLICVDCKWHIPSVNTTSVMNYDRCKASETINLITGEATYKYCETLRAVGNLCDLDGKLFELNIDDEVTGHGI